jgi:hypothetical protein
MNHLLCVIIIVSIMRTSFFTITLSAKLNELFSIGPLCGARGSENSIVPRRFANSSAAAGVIVRADLFLFSLVGWMRRVHSMACNIIGAQLDVISFFRCKNNQIYRGKKARGEKALVTRYNNSTLAAFSHLAVCFFLLTHKSSRLL